MVRSFGSRSGVGGSSLRAERFGREPSPYINRSSQDHMVPVVRGRQQQRGDRRASSRPASRPRSPGRTNRGWPL